LVWNNMKQMVKGEQEANFTVYSLFFTEKIFYK